ncbi:TonB-dependent receptor [Spirosoma arcticum]
MAAQSWHSIVYRPHSTPLHLASNWSASHPSVNQLAGNVHPTQSVSVKGRVSSETGEGLPGVNVLVKATGKGTVTDSDGRYALTVPEGNETLVFSYIGYVSKEVAVNRQTTIDVSLATDTKSLSEVVVVGYGTQKRANVTGAIGSIKTQDINNITVGNSSALIQGKVAGVRVENAGGSPGAGVNIVIRGSGTFGNDQPLYVIDGNITGSMSSLNPSDIESIEVLKDASAAAIYGNRAANGVVLVTTKSGTSGATRINFSAKLGTQSAANKLKFLNARQYADYRNQANDNDGTPRSVANTTGFNPAVDTDWQNLSLRAAPVMDYNLSLSGGNQTTKYFISGQYFDQKGIVVDSDFKRYNLRANSSFTKGRFKLTESLALSRGVNNPNTYFGRENGEIPTLPIYDDKNDGGFAGINPQLTDVRRGVNWYGLAQLNDNQFTTDQVLGSLSGEYEIIDGLRYKLNVGLDYSVFSSYNYTPTFFFSNTDGAFNQAADLTESVSRNIGTLIENTLNYTKSFGDHSVDLLAGYTQQLGTGRSIGAQVADFPSNDLRVVDASNVKVNSFGNLQQFALRSLLGRVNYNYKGRYLLGATIRQDESSRFIKENRRGTFPSYSVGWRLSDEPFFPKNSLVSDLKIRGSYGKLGSQNIGNYVTSSVLNINASYYFPGGVQPGTALTNFANPNVVWETTTTSDIGADVSLLNGKLAFTFDYFNKRSEGILTDLPIPIYGGVGSSIVKNAATIENKGVELSGTYNHAPGANGLRYSITANFSAIRNKVLALGEGVSPISGGGFTIETLTATRTDVGQPVGSFYGYVVDGIYQSQDQIAKDGRTSAVPGDFKYRDVNGDGKLDNNDQTFLGSPIPKFEYGTILNASYRSFDLNLFVQGVQGNKIWNAKKYMYLLAPNGNRLLDASTAWTPQNTDTDVPRATLTDPANNKRASSFYVENGSYFRVKSLQIGYTLPASLMNRIKIGSARVSVSGQNLLTFTNYTGYDPEVGRNASTTQAQGLFGSGVDVETYPQARSIFVGLDLTF